MCATPGHYLSLMISKLLKLTTPRKKARATAQSRRTDRSRSIVMYDVQSAAKVDV